MDKKQEKAMNQLDQGLETFNPTWHDGEFLGPNAVRYESGKVENQNQTHNVRREGMGPNTKRKPN